MKLKIEKGIPIPGNKGPAYALVTKMEVTDSIVLPYTRIKVYNLLTQIRKKHKRRKFTTKAEGTNVRVWRTN